MDAFILEEFGGAQLGDERLDRRLRHVACDLARDPGKSIPGAAGSSAAAKAAYRFFSHGSVTRERVMQPHVESTIRRVLEEPVVLVVEDTTTLSYSHHPAAEGMGKIGARQGLDRMQGVLVHSALAVTVGRHEALGILDQEVIVRKGYQPPQESRRSRIKRPRESGKWMSCARRVLDRLKDPSRAIFVFDREGDVFEVLEGIQDLGGRFVIRASWNRLVRTADGKSGYALDEVRREAVMARMEVRLAPGGGRRERIARVCVRAGRYEVLPPRIQPGGRRSRRVHLVHVKEEDPPPGVEGLEWFLLTGEPIDTPEEAMRVVEHYRGRWKIEEWHKALKTGCRMEDRQLETWDRLEVLLGILSVMAWRLLALRDAAKRGARAPDPLTETQRLILRKMDPGLGKKSCAQDYLVAIAKLGGFLARKSDGNPGWITLWRGWTRLRDVEVGFALNQPSGDVGNG